MLWYRTDSGNYVNFEHMESLGVREIAVMRRDDAGRGMPDAKPEMKWSVQARPIAGKESVYNVHVFKTEAEARAMVEQIIQMIRDDWSQKASDLKAVWTKRSPDA